MQNPHCHFSMDEPIESFSPVQGVQAGEKFYTDRLTKRMLRDIILSNRKWWGVTFLADEFSGKS